MATVSVVTGAASGIGRAAAERLAARGDRLVLLDIDEAGGAAAASDLGAAFVALDLTQDDSIRAAAEQVLGEHGKPAALVNAAGWDRLEPFLENSWEFMDRIVALNLLGATKLTQALLPAMIEAGTGRIVNIASDAGRVGSTGETIYAGAKGGIIAFTKSLAREVAQYQITANCVCPGPTDTPLFRSLPERMQQALQRAIPFRRLAEPREVAAAIEFFASEDASFITGQVLSVSGGLTMAG
jgi:2-hydroxycyclohexanecarboxyl-CoA dehydrogenase